MKNYNMTISVNKMKINPFKGKWPIQCKIIIDGHVLEQATNFQYLN